jgi:GNAT superfamily N-acetyltransferase
MTDIILAKGYQPGAIGRVAELHGDYYHRHWGFGLFFEAKVATELAAFFRRYDDARDGFWGVIKREQLEGAIVVDGRDANGEGAHLRWFIMSDGLRGQGAGNRLMETAMDFCHRRGYVKIYLWTFEGLAAARHLYEKHGFALVNQRRGDQWGVAVNEQRFEWSGQSNL